jgi:predicted alpha/beta-fold hydrolase
MPISSKIGTVNIPLIKASLVLPGVIYYNLYCPLHGFADAEDFYARASAGPYLGTISIPTLMLSAWNDPMLAPASFPVEEARNHSFLYLETPYKGGHVGFSRMRNAVNWAEICTLGFALPALST